MGTWPTYCVGNNQWKACRQGTGTAATRTKLNRPDLAMCLLIIRGPKKEHRIDQLTHLTGSRGNAVS